MPSLSDLLQPAYYLPAAKCAGLGLALFLAAWWRPSGKYKTGFSLLLLGLAWVLCHLLVDYNSYKYPPNDASNWLAFGALALSLTGIVALLPRHREGFAAVLAGILLGVTAWLALHKVNWFLDRTETAREKWLWTSGLISAVLASFGAAEALARKIPAVLLLTVLAIFIALTVAVQMTELAGARLLTVAALTLGAAVAAALHTLRRQPLAALPPGLAGWIAGGSILLFILACLSRVPDVPVLPMAIAAATFPVAALLIYTMGRVLGAAPVLFTLVVLGGGASLVWFGREPARPPATTTPTGADDTGAYDDL